jgi:hypothetical protein
MAGHSASAGSASAVAVVPVSADASENDGFSAVVPVEGATGSTGMRMKLRSVLRADDATPDPTRPYPLC